MCLVKAVLLPERKQTRAFAFVSTYKEMSGRYFFEYFLNNFKRKDDGTPT